jgi:hypothetical protein
MPRPFPLHLQHLFLDGIRPLGDLAGNEAACIAAAV